MRILKIGLVLSLIFVSLTCQRGKEPILKETVSFEQNSAYLPFDLSKEGQRATMVAKIHVKYITTSEYKLKALLTTPDGEVISADVERMPEGEINPKEQGKSGVVELKRHAATDEYRLFSFITKAGPYEIEFFRDTEFMGAELDKVELTLLPQ